MRFPVALNLVHKWLAAIVGVQVVLWVSGGVVMSAFPIERVRGEHNAAPPLHRQIGAADLGLSLTDVLAAAGPVTSIRTNWVAGTLYLEVDRHDLPTLLVDAASGAVTDGVDADLARAVARADFTGDGQVAAVTWQVEPSTEYRGALPVWRVDFDDADSTTLYVSPANGRLLARRNDTWRLYDFFWMLHIMDYEAREDFNHPLLITAAAVALVVVSSGFVLLFFRVRRSDWRALRRA